MATHRRTWQKAEQRAADLFGAQRQPGSGSQGRPDRSTSDSNHPVVYLECKLRARCAVRTLFDETALKAELEGKLPVVALFEKGQPGFLVVCHSSQAAAVLAEIAAANGGIDQ